VRTQRRWLVFGLVVAMGAVLASVVSAASGSSDRPPVRAWGFEPQKSAPAVIPHVAGATMLVVRLQATTATYVDNPPTGTTSPGDELAVEGQLVSVHGTPVGHLEVHEAVTGMGPGTGGRIQLSFTALLAGGQISGTGVAGFNTATPALAVVGGTGKYLGARGEVFAHTGPHRTRLTFLLLPRG
jgi:hypothetical protein